MFENLKLQSEDKIMALISLYKADVRKEKIDLGVGVYKNNKGQTPIMDAVQKASRILNNTQKTKSYVGLSGNLGFIDNISQLVLAVISVITVGIGGGIYLVSNLGAGPRDGLMIGLQKVTNFPIAAVRATLEISVVSVGWYLGGTVGIGTLLFAFGIGPCVALGLYLVDKIFD